MIASQHTYLHGVGMMRQQRSSGVWAVSSSASSGTEQCGPQVCFRLSPAIPLLGRALLRDLQPRMLIFQQPSWWLCEHKLMWISGILHLGIEISKQPGPLPSWRITVRCREQPLLGISRNSQRLLFSGFRIEMEVAVLGLDYEVTKNYFNFFFLTVIVKR